MQAQGNDRSLGELFTELSRETGELIRKEMELAKTEMTAKARVAGGHAGTIAAGGALGHAGLLVLLGAIVMALTALGLPPWASALIVAIAVMAVGYVLVTKGLSKMRETNLTPTQTIESLKETATWTSRTKA